jgi:hypothetical protein
MMELPTLIEILPGLSFSVIFLWLYLKERQRVREVTEREIATLRECVSRCVVELEKQRKTR